MLLCDVLCFGVAVLCSKLDAPWADMVFNHLKAAQQRAEGNPADAFQLYTAQG
jgi:hypothetical protein